MFRNIGIPVTDQYRAIPAKFLLPRRLRKCSSRSWRTTQQLPESHACPMVRARAKPIADHNEYAAYPIPEPALVVNSGCPHSVNLRPQQKTRPESDKFTTRCGHPVAAQSQCAPSPQLVQRTNSGKGFGRMNKQSGVRAQTAKQLRILAANP